MQLLWSFIYTAMCELGVESVETLFLALPEMPSEESLQILKAFWEVGIFFFNVLYNVWWTWNYLYVLSYVTVCRVHANWITL